MKVSGLELKVTDVKAFDFPCSEFSKFETKLFYILLKQGTKKSLWEKVERKCLSTFSTELQLIKAILENPTNSGLKRKKLISQFSLEKETKKLAFKILKVKEDKRANIELFKDALRLSSQSDEKEFQKYFRNKKMMDYLEIFNNPYFSLFFTPLIAVNAKNMDWFISSIKKLIISDPRRALFFNKQDLVLEKFMEEVVSLYNKEIKEDYLREAFQYFVLDHFTVSKEIRKEFQSPSMIVAREALDKSNMARAVFPVWLNTIYNLSSSKEFSNYFNRYTRLERLYRMNADQMFLFELLWPTNDIKREILVKKLSQYLRSKDTYQRFIVISLLQNKSVQSSFGQSKEKIDTPIFSLKRKFYKKSLDKGDGINYVIYNLLLLGDYNDDYLWWLVL